jgi:hypothetical protein
MKKFLKWSILGYLVYDVAAAVINTARKREAEQKVVELNQADPPNDDPTSTVAYPNKYALMDVPFKRLPSLRISETIYGTVVVLSMR